MPIKYADKIIKEIKERGLIKIPDNCATGEEFEKYLRRNKNFMTVNEIKDKLKSNEYNFLREDKHLEEIIAQSH